MFHEAGQGLLEMIVAMGIITTGIAATVSLVQATLSASSDAALRLVGAELAREGIEAVRDLRDANWLAGQPWDTGLVGPTDDRTGVPVFVPGASPWSVDWTAATINDNRARVFRYGNAAGALKDLMVQTATGAAPAGSALTAYRRFLALYPICRSAVGVETILAASPATCGAGLTEVGLDARVTVRWAGRGGNHVATAEEKLYDWR